MDAEREGRKRAERFRDDFRLGTGPLPDLVTTIEQTVSADVAVLPAPPDEHGMTLIDPILDAIYIGVARTPNHMRQRSTLAHELGHVVFGDGRRRPMLDLDPDSYPERRARAFARHLLIPLAGVRDMLGAREHVALAQLSAVVQRFLVSPAIAARALRQAGYIDQETCSVWQELHTPVLATRFGWSDQYIAMQAASDRWRAPQNLLARAIRGYQEGVVPVQALANLRGVTSDVVLDELSAAGIVPIEPQVEWTVPSGPAVPVDLSDLDEGPPDEAG